jgi:hypothetical protein
VTGGRQAVKAMRRHGTTVRRVPVLRGIT